MMRPGDPGYYRATCDCPATTCRKLRTPPPPAAEPPPEVLSTDPWPLDAPEVPRAVRRLQKAAQGAGWVALLAFSRGPERAVRVGEYKMTEVFAVWAGPHPGTGWRFNAIHTRTPGAATGWTWRSTAVWRRGRPRFRHATITDLHEFISVCGDVGEPWFKAVHARAEAKRGTS
jgi:hypothetical protein